MKKWTIMVYMCGDNNLSIEMAYALQDIREAARNSGGEINILAYYDGNLPDVPTYYYDFSDFDSQTQVISADLENKLHPDHRAANGSLNENAAYAYSVINFVDWCVNKVEYKDQTGKKRRGRKAENYALIFSGHSFGFQDLGLFRDETSGFSMTHKKLSFVFDRLTKPKKRLEKGETEILGKKLAILGFDSCVMSMLEVGYQFHEFAETLIASEGSLPNAGWTYGKLLGNICTKQRAADSRRTARKFVKQFIESQSAFAIGGVSVDMAAWDCAKIPAVADAFERLTDLLFKCFEDEKSALYKQMKRILLQVHWNCQSYMYEQNIDLKDFCRLLFEEVDSLEKEFGGDFRGMTGNLKSACYEVMKKLEDCIILSGFSGGQYQFSNGISLFFPWTLPSYQVSQTSYENLSFYNLTEAGKKWNQFLQFYLTNVSMRLPQTAEVDQNDKILETSLLDSLAKPVIYRYDVKIPQNTANKIPQNTANKIPQNTANKIPQNTANKIPQNTANKLPFNPMLKIPQNTANKIPQNTANKIPQNIVNKMFGGTDSFFHYFMSMKNVVTPWNVFGFTGNVEEKTYDKR